MTYAIRNPVFTADGRIDLEIEHSEYGWIPFTADPEDPVGVDYYVEALELGPGPYVPPPVSVPVEISDRQFFQALAQLGLISEEEAIQAVTVGQLPSAMQAMIASFPSEAQFSAKMLLQGATVFQRNHPLTGQIANLTSPAMTEEQVDAIWILGNSL